MKYLELKIISNREESEIVQAVLMQAGFSSMLIDDSSVAYDILADPRLYKYDYLGDEIRDLAENVTEDICITLYFENDEDGRERLSEAEEILIKLNKELDQHSGESSALEKPDKSGADIIRFETAITGDDSEWLYKWQENFKPTKVGERIVVKPSWEDYAPAEGELVIEMDPGMAFGSGLHETTSMCIKALEKILHDPAQSKHHLKVLDVGTGTGILSITAVLLGANECLGIDIDDEAIRVGAENVERNGLKDRIQIEKGDLVEGVDFEADIVVANLMTDLVMKLAPAAFDHLRPGGFFISSGILDVKEAAVSEAVMGFGFDIVEVFQDGEWRAIVAVRKMNKS